MDNAQKHDFSKGSISRAIVRLAFPMALAQLINIAYNIVDRMYIGHTPDGRLAFTGMGLVLPIVMIIMGFANLCGSGGTPLASMARGRGDHRESGHILTTSFLMILALGVTLTVVFLALRQPLLYLLGADSETFVYAEQYISVYLLGTVMVMISFGMNPFINMQGFGRIGMMTVALGAVVNIALDPLFIFVFDMGVTGAALASVIAQTCSAVWVLRFLTGKKATVLLRLKDYVFKLETVGRIAALGVAGLVMFLTTSIVQIICNKTLLAWGGNLYVSVMSAIGAVREIAAVGMISITSSAVPVLSFNYGAKQYERIRRGIRFTTLAAIVAGVIPWVFIMVLPAVFIKIFNADPALLDAGVPAFRIYFSCSFFMAFQLTGQIVSQSLGRAKSAIFFSLLRKAILVAPLTLLLPRLWGLGTTGVFLAEPISNVVGGLSCYITMIFIAYIPLGRLARENQEVLS